MKTFTNHICDAKKKTKDLNRSFAGDAIFGEAKASTRNDEQNITHHSGNAN